MIHRESWHIEADDRGRLLELVRLLSSKEDYDASMAYRELAKLVLRLDLKDIPPMNNVHKRGVFLWMFPRLVDDLRRMVLKITQRSAREMLPYISIHDGVEGFALELLEMIGQAGWQWINYKLVDLPLMEELQKRMVEWDSLMSHELPPSTLQIPENQPWLTQETLEEKGVDLPFWFRRAVPSRNDWYVGSLRWTEE